MPNAAESSGISREATGVIRFIDLPHGAVRPATLHEGADEPMPRGDVFSLDGPVIITIDGPAGTGKSSVARLLARRLGLDFLDTGAMYRAAAALSIDRGVTDEAELIALVERARIRFDWLKDPPEVLAFGASLAGRIRDPDVTAIVSPIASIGALRKVMVGKQRAIAREHPRLVTEGRDQGSVVFPDAHVKFYLDASAEERARRRAEQLRAEGRPADEERLKLEIVERDRCDMQRADGPLVVPAGALIIDTSALSRDEVVDRLEKEVRTLARP